MLSTTLDPLTVGFLLIALTFVVYHKKAVADLILSASLQQLVQWNVNDNNSTRTLSTYIGVVPRKNKKANRTKKTGTRYSDLTCLYRESRLCRPTT